MVAWVVVVVVVTVVESKMNVQDTKETEHFVHKNGWKAFFMYSKIINW